MMVKLNIYTIYCSDPQTPESVNMTSIHKKQHYIFRITHQCQEVLLSALKSLYFSSLFTKHKTDKVG